MRPCKYCGALVEPSPEWGATCRACIRAYKRNWMRAARANGKCFSRENPERKSLRMKTYNARPEVKRRESDRKGADLQREPYRTRILARAALRWAVRSGRIHPKPCEVCGDTNVHGHHDDHSKPLEVRWLCPKCHRAEHKRAVVTP